MPLEILQLILSALSQSFIISQTYSYNKEIIDGGTKNKIWLFLTTLPLISFAIAPIMMLFPSLILSLGSYAFMAVAAGIMYVASVAHANQMAINQNEHHNIQTLPYRLHENKYLMSAALFFSHHLANILLGCYMAGLIGCMFLGAPLFAYASLAFYGVNLLNQNGYMPSFLRTPYLYLNIIIAVVATFGIASWLGIAISTVIIGFTVYDYIQCNLLKKNSPTAQFPMAELTKKLTIKTIDDNDPEALEKLTFTIHKHLRYKNKLQINVTFNHFYQSHILMDKILSNMPKVNYTDFVTHFNRLNFASLTLQDAISNEMCLHDKFNEKSLDERKVEMGLSSDTSLIHTQIAYLKKEMGYFTYRLQNTSYRDLTHQQVAEIHRYSRFLLNKINTMPIVNQANALSPQETLLLSIATRTGSHCNRIYLDTLSELCSEPTYNFLKAETLTLQERAVMMAQSLRERAFRTYYYKTAPILKKLSPVYAIAWDDLNDYHTYENFVQVFGSNFYLRNPALMSRYRDISDVLMDRFITYSFNDLEPIFLFSSTYTATYLIEQTVNPEGKLHLIFIEWCEEKYPSCYQKMVYNENYRLNEGAELNALAELMLLDLEILHVLNTYPVDEYIPTSPVVSSPTLNRPEQVNSSQCVITSSIRFFDSSNDESTADNGVLLESTNAREFVNS